ncbi:hypothetical protein K3U93_02760 [Mycobacterium malmoense]|uniref:PE-PGRS family protein n=1 Tax=Mycobacterium malmoense TaxID=1780 RepID=A0ABX3SLI9_MYCMA|nr:hypothetical protein [Mycobacterium malmoense]ORA78505.1 hypothetical protein BST29_21375 [Mycobacterium malmoense]QZA18154.1 hypothetical protein K3U93_02760 [Mycobacterium malmoense]
MVVDLAARPHSTATVALASAAVLAAGSTAPHLPDLHLGQHLPPVSVSGINLTDTSSVLDLFSGVENELASLASGAAAAEVPAAALTDFINPAALPLPLQTWVNVFQTAGTNIQGLYNSYMLHPFPVLQQVAANFLQYGVDYVQPLQTVANHAVNFYAGTGASSFSGLLQSAFSSIAAGSWTAAQSDFFDAFYLFPLEEFGLPLESILQIPANIATNIANFTNTFTTTGIADLGASLLLSVPIQTSTAMGTALQAVSDSFNAGDPVGTINNLLNVPGAVANGFLNGIPNNPAKGLLSVKNGGLTALLETVPQLLAKQIVAPGAQNIMSGGSLTVGFQNLVNQLTNGWPSLSNIAGDLTSLLQNIPSLLSNLPSALSGFAGAVGGFVGQLGTLLINLLKLL